MHIELSRCVVRQWRVTDAVPLARHANSRRIWLNLRDAFPHPYTVADADAFLAHVTTRTPPTHFAIEVNGEAAGGIGFNLQSDVNRLSAELGYWLGEAHWGRGIMTEAVRAVTAHGFDALGVRRIFALPFAANAASARVLEKAGYRLEGVMREAVIKDGRITDQLLYAITASG